MKSFCLQLIMRTTIRKISAGSPPKHCSIGWIYVEHASHLVQLNDQGSVELGQSLGHSFGQLKHENFELQQTH